jgi:hypothetical protein
MKDYRDHQKWNPYHPGPNNMCPLREEAGGGGEEIIRVPVPFYTEDLAQYKSTLG